MIGVCVLILFILSVLADRYICNKIISNRLAANVYKWLNIVIYVVVGGRMVLNAIVGDISSAGLRMTMWVIWLCIIVSLPKLLFTFCALFGKTRARIVGCVLALLSIGFIWFCTFETRTDLKVTETTILHKEIPQQFDGYKIALFSDLHLETMMDDELLEDMVEQINDLNVDLVVNCGDIVNRSYEELTSENLSLLSEIKATDGVYSVLGNHDLGFYIKDQERLPKGDNQQLVISKLSSIGWQWLCDSSTVISRGGDFITLSGVSYPDHFKGPGHANEPMNVNLCPVYDSLTARTFNITLCHAPQLWRQILAVGDADLTLSGHIHAMQMKFFGHSPAEFLYEEWSGLYRDGDSYQYITDGVGSVGFPMRISVRPEVVLIELRKKI